MVQWLALLLHTKNALGSIPGQGPQVVLQSKDMHIWLTGDNKLPLYVNVCALRCTSDLSRMHYCIPSEVYINVTPQCEFSFKIKV